MSISPLGTLETRDDGLSVLRFERRIGHPPEKVWSALTRPDELIGWWGDADVDLVEGGTFTVRWRNTDDRGERAVYDGTITRLEPGRLLETQGEGHGTLRWELAPDDGATLLTFTSELELPDEYRTKNLAGWHTHLDALETVLDGGSVDLVEIEEIWEPVHERYLAQHA
jgi:uncharacterized protein YndB with AHSA1/START domain